MAKKRKSKSKPFNPLKELQPTLNTAIGATVAIGLTGAVIKAVKK